MQKGFSHNYQWAVVGGGMLGLSTALRLAKADQQVTLFESGPTIGGLTSSWQIGDAQWDMFYHVILLTDTKLRALLTELCLDKEIQWVTTRTGFYCDGRLHSLSSSLEFLRFPPLNFWQKFRLGATIFYASKIRNADYLEQIPVEAWLRKLSGDSTFEQIWQPLLRAKLGNAYQRTSALFIWATIDRMYKARRSGMKREMFGFVPGGYRRILNQLHEKVASLGVTIQTSSPVNQIHYQSDSGRFQVTLGHDDQRRLAEFDRVMMTVPSPVISKACPQLTQDEHYRLRQAEYLGVICTSLLLDQPLGGYYVTNITDNWVPLTGIIEMGSIVRPELLVGKYLVYLPQYMLADDPRFGESDDAIHDRCLATLEKMYPDFNRARVHAIRTARARHVMTIPTLEYSSRMPHVISSVPGLYLLNSAQIKVGCLNVNEILELVERNWSHFVS